MLKGLLSRRLSRAVSLSLTVTSSFGSNVRSTTASGSQVYDTQRAVNEYLLFHYGDANNKDIQMPYAFGPKDALDFTSRTAKLCDIPNNYFKQNVTSRCLDIGCSVGGSSFELTKIFNEVIGIDYSQHFIDAANKMKDNKQITYEILKQGKIYIQATATLSSDIDVSKVLFRQGDACSLDPSLDKFDVIHASNLMCRLPSPRAFLRSLPHFLKPHGYLVLISPYSWLEEYTPLNEWVGGGSSGGSISSSDGKDEMNVKESITNNNNNSSCSTTTTTSSSSSSSNIASFDQLKNILENECHLQFVRQEDIPFLIREHERKFQYGVSDATIWQLKN